MNTIQFVHSHGIKSYPFMLHQACLNPYGSYEVNLFSVMPLDQAMSYVYSFITIWSNLYLARFLKEQEENNSALSTADRKKDRKKNLIPAKTGTYSVILMVFTVILYTFLYGLSTKFGVKLDTGTKALLIAVYNDFVTEIVNPCIIMWGAPTIKRKIMKVGKKIAKSLHF